MMPSRNISSLFNKFAGKEVSVSETQKTLQVRGKSFTVDQAVLDPNDPTIEEMKKVAGDNGLRLRIWLPGTVGTMDMRMDRVNAHVEKGTDGKWRVSSRFNIG